MKFPIRPRIGDVWEYTRPTKRKIRKQIGRIFRTWYTRARDGKELLLPTIEWKREAKGRRTHVRVKWLLQYGRLILRVGKPKRRIR